mmetsp:Transcript_25028/g.71298  ORF Transcript_25028/g.71298 Transcript_25028/m.71298 type:complete len:651 (-) Transcript_25028:1818-3770(-)
MLCIILELGVRGYQCILRADVQVVVEPPVHRPDPSGWVPQALQQILQHLRRTKRHAEAVNCIEHRHDQVRRSLENVGPDVIHQVLQGILAVEALHAQRQVLDGPRGRLPVDQVSVHEGVLENRRHGVDVVLAHLADVLEHEAQTLEHAVLHIQLRHTILVHERWQHRERTARLRDDGDGDGGTDTQLTLLNLEVVQQGAEHVVRADGLGDVAEGVDGGAADGLLVRLQQLEKVEADTVPLSGRRQLGSTVRNTPDQIDAILLHLLVPVLEDWRQPRQQVLDRRRHLRHTDDVHNGLHRSQNRTQHLRVLLAEVLVEEEAQVTHHLLLATLLHDHRDARDEIRGLLTHAGRGRVQAPPDDTGDLRQVRLHAGAERIHDCAKAIEHHRGVVRGLFLEGVDDTVDDLLLEAGVDVCHTKVADDLVDGLHDHLAIRLRCILQILHDPADDVSATNLAGDLHGCVDQLPIVAAVKGHPDDPEVSEEGRQDILSDVARLDTLGGDALLDHLEHNLLHLLIRRRKLSDQNDHHLSRVVVRVLGIHQWDDVTDSLQEGRQALATMLADALPEGSQHSVEGLDAVWRGSLSECSQCQGANGTDLLLLILQAVGDDINHLLQVGQHGAAHENSDLLHNFDAGVSGLPALLRLAHRTQEEE